MADADVEKRSTKESVVGVISNSSATAVNDVPSRTPSVADTDAFPDGGAAAWLTVLGAFLALFCSFGQLNSFGTFQTWYAEHQLSHLPPSTIAWIGSLQLWVFFFSGGFVGRLFDAHGPRVILIFGTLILVFGTMMTSISTHYYQYILSQGVLVAIGIGTVFYPSLAAISTHFKKYRSTALGIAVAGSGVGGVVYPIMYQQLFNRVGFAWTVRISGFISLALCGVAIATITSRLSKPQDNVPWFDSKVFHDAPFRLVIAGSVFISFGVFIPFFYIVDYSTDHGISHETAFYVLSVMNAGGILGRLAPAFLADRLGRFNVVVPCTIVAGISTLVLWTFAHSLAAIMLFAVIYGFFSGAFNALVIPCVVQISDVREYGTRIGVLYSIVSFPALCGGPVAGAMLKAEGGSYVGMTMLAGTSVIAGALFLLWARFSLSPRFCDRV
ncbi:MFS general substrate transporter [Trametes versicolor FP-101664 SS1]|uniref:MFS general substrate transporter n=1 Tax=Trametes versicolor (strain FP-101664) TaxID=717944 RepID=UPI0004621507|nr:MFS general substrate transporter [Trametes versicolor FP-101664 SS1]EIW52352.1 MFS general substrate transporter [Trametes versicolor FP-101664 SS1]